MRPPPSGAQASRCPPRAPDSTTTVTPALPGQGGGGRGRWRRARQPAGRRGHQDRDGRTEPGVRARSARDPDRTSRCWLPSHTLYGAPGSPEPRRDLGGAWRPGGTRESGPSPLTQTRWPAATPVRRMRSCSPASRCAGGAVKSPSALGAQRSTGSACAEARRHWSLSFFVIRALRRAVAGRRRRSRRPRWPASRAHGLGAGTWSCAPTRPPWQPACPPASPSAHPARPVLLALEAPRPALSEKPRRLLAVGQPGDGLLHRGLGLGYLDVLQRQDRERRGVDAGLLRVVGAPSQDWSARALSPAKAWRKKPASHCWSSRNVQWCWRPSCCP